MFRVNQDQFGNMSVSQDAEGVSFPQGELIDFPTYQIMKDKPGDYEILDGEVKNRKTKEVIKKLLIKSPLQNTIDNNSHKL